MTDTARILLVDDDAELREILVERLQNYGFSSFAVANGEEMFQALVKDRFDLILLDVMIPGEDGLSLCRRLRLPGSPYAELPIIFLTALGDASDRVVGLELGGDDYLAKPFESRELIARIRALLRRSRMVGGADSAQEELRSEVREEGEPGGLWTFGCWQLNVLARHLTDSEGKVIPLSSAEYRLLMLFLQHPQQVLSREQIMESLNQRQYDVFDRSVDVQISRLRSKLRDKGRSPDLIRTMRGDGYMMAVQVQKSGL